MTDIDSLKAWAHRLHQRVEWLEKTILPYADARATTAEVFLRAPQCEIERLARQLRSGIDAVQRVEAQLAAREGEIATLKEQALDSVGRLRVHMEEVVTARRERDARHSRELAAEARADTAEARLRAQEESLDELRETCNEAAATGRAGTKLLTESERRIYERLALALAPPITKESQP